MPNWIIAEWGRNKIPKTAEEWTNLGKSFLNSNKCDETIKACEHALQFDLHFAPAWKLLAKAYFCRKLTPNCLDARRMP